MKKLFILIAICFVFFSCKREVTISIRNSPTEKFKYEYRLKSTMSTDDDDTVREYLFDRNEDLFIETGWNDTVKVFSNKDLFNVEQK